MEDRLRYVEIEQPGTATKATELKEVPVEWTIIVVGYREAQLQVQPPSPRVPCTKNVPETGVVAKSEPLSNI